MKTFLLALALFPIYSQAADFTGLWRSTEGKITSNIGWNGTCRLIEIQIRQTPTAIITEKYKADCPQYSTDWGPVTQEIRDGKVFERGEQVGTFDGTTLRSAARDGAVTYIYDLQLTKDSNGNDLLNSRYGVLNFVGRIYTDAPMQRVQ